MGQTLRWFIWPELAKVSWDEQAAAAYSSSMLDVLGKEVSEEMCYWDSKAWNISAGKSPSIGDRT